MKTFMQCKKCTQIRGGVVVRNCHHSWEEREQSQLENISIGDCGAIFGYCYEVRRYHDGTSSYVPFLKVYDTIEEAYGRLLKSDFSDGEILRYARHNNSKSEHPWITAGVVYRKINGEMYSVDIGEKS